MIPPAELGGLERSARFTDSRKYRYNLRRKWGVSAPLNVIMLNPSKADEQGEDPTITRVMDFAHREGFRELSITNLFAYVSTESGLLKYYDDPVGPLNDDVILTEAVLAGQVWVAWGAHPMAGRRAAEVAHRLRPHGIRLWCLGMNEGGSPKHPLYLRQDTPLIPWEGA